VLLEGITEVGDAERVAERINEGLREPFFVAGRIMFVTASIGIALDGPAETQPGDLLREADIAMVRAKTRERSQFEVFSPEKDIHALKRLESEEELRRAIEQGQLRLHYQPLISLMTGEIIGVEALARWEHPERGLVLPLKFIPLAEETGLILPLGSWVLEEACRQGREWQESHPGNPPLIVSVNLSAKQLQRNGLGREVARVLEKTGMDPRGLMLEITESEMMEDPETAVEVFRDLAALGVQVAIDDFGKGHSSLSYLKTLPIDILKIDRSFVGELETDPRDEEIVSAMVDLAHALRLRVIAEGVETPGQLDRLEGLAADFAQGYHFSRPLPAEFITQLLSTKVR
jgi:EAL domain-containing protein (putative c-di-GMP-specific phosphodiesterase class I)